MKVSYITTQFPAPSETFACNDVRALKELGVDISVFTLRSKHKNYEKMLVDRGVSDVPFFPCGVSENIKGFLYLLLKFPLALQLLAWLLVSDRKKYKHLVKCVALFPASFYILYKLEKNQPDVVHLFWGHYPSLVGYLVNKRLPDVKLTMFLGAYDLEIGLGISSRLAQKVDHVFTHAFVNLVQLENLGISSDRVLVIHRGVDVYSLVGENDEKDDVIVCIGRLVKKKNFDISLYSFHLLLKKKPNALLYLIGDGPERKELTRLVVKYGLSDKVVLTGHINHSEAMSILSKGSVFMLPSECAGERLPNAVKEAMLLGVVPVVAQSPGMEELVTDGVDGFIINPPLTPEDFSKKILEILDSSDIKTRLSNSAVKKIKNSFCLYHSMEKYLNTWSNKG